MRVNRFLLESSEGECRLVGVALRQSYRPPGDTVFYLIAISRKQGRFRTLLDQLGLARQVNPAVSESCFIFIYVSNCLPMFLG